MIITDMVKVNDVFYCLLQDYNGIFRFREEKKELELEVRFPTRKINFWLYSKMVVYGNKIVCVPDFASEIAIYDLQSKELKMLPLKAPRIKDSFYDGKHKFLSGCAYESYVLMIGAKYPAIVRIDMGTYKTEYFDEWVDEMRSMDIYKESWRIFFRRSGAILNGYLYLAGECAPICLKLDLCSMCHSWISIGGENYKIFNDCFVYGDTVWFMPVFHDSVIELDSKENICSEYCMSDNFYENGKIILSEAALLDNNLFFFYQNDEKVVMYNVETKKIEKIIFIKATIEDECKGYGRYKFVGMLDNQVVAYSRALDRIVVMNRNGEYRLWELKFGSEYNFMLFAKRRMVKEQEGYQLRDFVKYVKEE